MTIPNSCSITEHALLTKAMQCAHKAHQGQVDKAGQPYINHPLRVMHQLQHVDAKIVAVLHDTLEDTMLSVNDLRQLGLTDLHLDALLALTKHSHENRFHALKRTLYNPLACEVKRADVYDNINLLRLSQITPKDLNRYWQYQLIFNSLEHACRFYAACNLILQPQAANSRTAIRSKTSLACALHICHVGI